MVIFHYFNLDCCLFTHTYRQSRLETKFSKALRKILWNVCSIILPVRDLSANKLGHTPHWHHCQRKTKQVSSYTTWVPLQQSASICYLHAAAAHMDGWCNRYQTLKNIKPLVVSVSPVWGFSLFYVIAKLNIFGFLLVGQNTIFESVTLEKIWTFYRLKD